MGEMRKRRGEMGGYEIYDAMERKGSLLVARYTWACKLRLAEALEHTYHRMNECDSTHIPSVRLVSVVLSPWLSRPGLIGDQEISSEY